MTATWNTNLPFPMEYDEPSIGLTPNDQCVGDFPDTRISVETIEADDSRLKKIGWIGAHVRASVPWPTKPHLVNFRGFQLFLLPGEGELLPAIFVRDRTYGDGTQTRSWGYIDDIVEGLARFFWRDAIDYPGPLNIGNNREISVGGVARYIGDLTGQPEIVHMPSPPDDPTNRCPDLTLANRILPGWKCEVPYEDGVRRTMQWFRDVMKPSPDVRRAK